MIKRFINWLLNLFKSEKLYVAKFTDEIPDKPDNITIYLIENQGYCWQAVMICPCGCKKQLNMNLMKDYHPHWQYKINSKNIITLNPSINRTVGCKSHFFVKQGKIIWA